MGSVVVSSSLVVVVVMVLLPGGHLVLLLLLLLLLSVELHSAVLLVLLRHPVHEGLAGHDGDVVVRAVTDLGERAVMVRHVGGGGGSGSVRWGLVGDVGHGGHGLLLGVHVRLHWDHLRRRDRHRRLVLVMVAPVQLS